MLVMLTVPPLVLFRVTLCAALIVPTGWRPKARVEAERLTTEAVPVPVRLTICGLPGALSLMLTAAVRLPTPEGVNVTLIVQLAPAPSGLTQVLV
jgi:hypothetical protein